jgi:hypothetical protein
MASNNRSIASWPLNLKIKGQVTKMLRCPLNCNIHFINNKKYFLKTLDETC